MTDKVIEVVMLLPQDIIKRWILGYVETKVYITSRNTATDFILNNFILDHSHWRFGDALFSVTQKVKVILKDLEKEGILEIYSRNNRRILYKKIEKEVM